jgi:hypothetical protein
VRVRIPVAVRLQKSVAKAVPEKTHTIVVSAHGGLVLMATKVEENQLVLIENLETNQELLCRVTGVGDSFMGKTQVGLEFILPAPDFWDLELPPKDWKPRRGK